MKKVISVLLAVLILFALASCSVDTGSADTKIIEGSGASNQTKGSDETTSPDEKSESATIDEQVCFEHDGIKVTAKSITEDSIWGTGIKLLVENTSSKDYTVGVKEVIVNNFMITSLLSSSVAAGKSANDTLYLSSDELEASGIKNIGQIEIYFYIFDSSTYETVYTSECITIKTSLFDTMDTTVDDAGHELYNKDGIKIVGKYVGEDSVWGSSVLLYIENKTDQNITVSCDDMSINGFMVTALLSSTVYSQKCSIDDITILSSSLEENEITSIDTVELKFNIYESDTFTSITNTDAISFTVK